MPKYRHTRTSEVSAKPAFSGESVEQVLEANKAGIIDYTHVRALFSFSSVHSHG